MVLPTSKCVAAECSNMHSLTNKAIQAQPGPTGSVGIIGEQAKQTTAQTLANGSFKQVIACEDQGRTSAMLPSISFDGCHGSLWPR